MSFAGERTLSDAILYEGYLLYPYRSSALKNRRDRWLFGVLRPPGGAEASEQRSEIVLRGGAATTVEALLRFLHPLADGPVAREVALGPVDLGALPVRHAFAFAPLHGELVLDAFDAGGATRLRVTVRNVTAASAGDDVLERSFASTHVLLRVAEGELVSPLDPPPDLQAAVASCANAGAWPVLIGSPDRRDAALCAPIILPDHPAIAPESPGDLFDGLEIDEILSLRVQTLTDAERAQAAAEDPRVARLLERTAALGPDELARLHGRLCLRRGMPPVRLRVGELDCGPGDRVVLRPRARADIFDLALAGRTATIASVEQDFDGRCWFTVTVDDDPGRDLGQHGRPGHRFWFAADEVEPAR